MTLVPPGAKAKAVTRGPRGKYKKREQGAPEHRSIDILGRMNNGKFCRFCAGIGSRRPPHGCPLGPIGCGLPFVAEVLR